MKLLRFSVLSVFLSLIVPTPALAGEDQNAPQGAVCLPRSGADDGYQVILIGGIAPEQRSVILAAIRDALAQSRTAGDNDAPAVGTIECGVCIPSE